MPLIYAMAQGSEQEKALIKSAIEKGGYDLIDEVQKIIHETGALEYTESIAVREANLAIEQLSHLPESEYKRALESLAHFSVQRIS